MMMTTVVKTSLGKINLRPLKLYRVFLDPLNLSNAGDFSWTGILKDFLKLCMFTSPIKRHIRRFHANV